ncbi:PEP-CTERM sorting domain-containing protein [Pedomonas mirosovicensis]|uniref:PEP-CTERM sorting domain-containing protein n=1 Tax=Pedomonas mirosovicensis TaxID=2908641 RepID=UPI0021673841|nr:PEP-CTERM sorting domain-containing protein [Pedomonas mirosovicensis]MCH8683980.1 PEP-CTERM sorting domain-containing protein [Pedomonas mirosovicensis]
MRKHNTLVATLVLLGFALPAGAAPVELIENGDFETGTFAGWTVNNQEDSGGTWLVETPGIHLPLSDNPTADNPAGGSFYAVSDMNNPGAHVLIQDFTVPFDATGVALTFQMFVNDWSNVGPIVDPAGLDFMVEDNQHARVDILTADADDFDTEDGVIANLYLDVDAGDDPNDYTSYAFDLTPFLTPGETYRLRFGQAETEFFLNVGVDNVSIIADVAAVPEPAALGLLGAGLLGMAVFRRRKAN